MTSRKAKLRSRSVFIPSPGPNIAVWAASYYTQRDGAALVSLHSHLTRGDTLDATYRRFSSDNGRTWSEAEAIPAFERRPGGMLRRHPDGGFADPVTGRFVTIRTEGLLPTDEPIEGMKSYALHYAVSEDGGRTVCVDEPVIHAGAEFNASHPVPGVWIGKNALMAGALPMRPLTLPDGTMLIPCMMTPLGPNGEYENRGGGCTYTEALVLRGRWRADQHIAWTRSATVAGDPNRSTRGMDEPTLGRLADGRILMVMRGSNDGKEHLPGYRWHSFSADGGATWTPSEPWRFTDGAWFYSPSSCSQLLAHSNGALWWLGNLCAENPHSNSPRYPFIVAEVDLETGQLQRDTVSTIDDRGADDSEALQLSNFCAREDRETGDIVLHMTRLFAKGQGDWTADALLYRITLFPSSA